MALFLVYAYHTSICIMLSFESYREAGYDCYFLCLLQDQRCLIQIIVETYSSPHIHIISSKTCVIKFQDELRELVKKEHARIDKERKEEATKTEEGANESKEKKTEDKSQ